MKIKTADIALIGLLSSLAVCLNIIEAIFIPQIIPGMKIGFANLVTVLSVFLLNFRHVLFIVLVRTMVSSFLLGTFFSVGFFLSFSGAVTSAVVIIILYHYDKNYSPIFLCISGAIIHNIAQLIVAYFFVGYGFLYFLPYLIVFAIPTGFITGKIVSHLLKYNIRPSLSNHSYH